MKQHFLFSICFLASIIFLNSCRNDFDIAAQWKEIPVVYGLLDADSSVQYIKVEKAFLDKSIGAYDMASKIDSIYYLQKLKVKLFATDPSTNSKIIGEDYTCTLVDGDSIGLKKDNGTFASSPNYFFRLKHKLDAKYNYNLEITKPDGSIVATAVTNVLGKVVFSQSYTTSSTGFNFYVKNIQTPNKIVFLMTPDANAVSCDLVIRTYYKEVPINSTDTTFHYADWNVLSNVTYVNGKALNDAPSFIGTGYYLNLKNELRDKPKNVKRFFNRLDFIAFSGNQIFEDYRNVINAQSGFTSGNSQPVYTNIIGGGLGLFASRNTTTLKDVLLSATSLDSIKKGRYTYDLGFDN
ncbi:MAG: hypothetical protein RJA07_2263 [Bacteroidota bacterium]|jgi:hypothetical protein